MASSGYGQQTPYDTTDPLAEITFIIRQMISKLGTMKVVQVVTVHGGGLAATGTVDVMPLVSQIDGNNNTQPHGVVYGLPYFRIQGGTNAIICDPVVGDIGYVVVSDRDISSVKKNASSITGSANPSPSNQVTPGSARRNDLADGVYVGGILNATPKQIIQFTTTGITIADMNGNQIVMGPGSVNIIGVLQSNGTPVAIP